MNSSLSVEGLKNHPDDYILVDLRSAENFSAGFIPGSLFMNESAIPAWMEKYTSQHKAVCLVTDGGTENIAMTTTGITLPKLHSLQGGWEAWKAAGYPFDMIIEIEPDELAMDLPFDENLVLLDLRSPEDFEAGHVEGAENMPLEELGDFAAIADLPENANLYLYGNHQEGLIAASILKSQGLHAVRHLQGGWQSLENTGLLKIARKPKAKDKGGEDAATNAK